MGCTRIEKKRDNKDLLKWINEDDNLEFRITENGNNNNNSKNNKYKNDKSDSINVRFEDQESDGISSAAPAVITPESGIITKYRVSRGSKSLIRRKKTEGQFMTPGGIVNMILDRINYFGRHILSETIMEPSFGDGAFLKEIIRRLVLESRKAGGHNDGIVNIIRRSVFGIEKDRELYTAAIERLNNLLEEHGIEPIDWSENLICGDALSLYGQFKNKMDYAVGNPPYVRVHNIPDEFREAVREFRFTDGMMDLYVVFYEMGLQILKNTGILGYISPNSFLKNSSQQGFRDYLIENKYLSAIYDFKTSKVFGDAGTYTCICILDKDSNREEHNAEYHECFIGNNNIEDVDIAKGKDNNNSISISNSDNHSSCDNSANVSDNINSANSITGGISAKCDSGTGAKGANGANSNGTNESNKANGANYNEANKAHEANNAKDLNSDNGDNSANGISGTAANSVNSDNDANDIIYNKEGTVVISAGVKFEQEEFKTKFLGKPWLLCSRDDLRFLEQNKAQPMKILNVAEVQNGVATNKDSVYIIRVFLDPDLSIPYTGKHSDESRTVYFNDKAGRNWPIESGILHRCVKGSRFNGEMDNTYIIFPYELSLVGNGTDEPVENMAVAGEFKKTESDLSIEENIYNPLSENRLMELFPKAYTYLKNNRDTLSTRDTDKGNNSGWFLFGRSQGIQNSCRKKIVFKHIIKRQSPVIRPFILDKDVIVYSGMYTTVKPGIVNLSASDTSKTLKSITTTSIPVKTDDNDMLVTPAGLTLSTANPDSLEDDMLLVICNIFSSGDFGRYCSIAGKDMSGGYASVSTKTIKEFGINPISYYFEIV